MSRYKWIECEALDKIENKVWKYVWGHKKKRNKDIKVEPPYSFSVKLENYEELYVVAHALIILSKNISGKALSNQHTEKVKPQMIKDAKALQKKLYKRGVIGAALDHMSEVIAELKQKNISTADEFAVKISNFVYNELLDIGASKKRAKNIKSFIKSAMIAIVKDRPQYEADFFALVQSLRYRNIKPLPMQAKIKQPKNFSIQHTLTFYTPPISISTYSYF